MKASAARQARPPRPITGWALDTLVRCDEVHPGILRYALSCSPLRRQAIFLTLACVRHDEPEQVAVRLGPLAGADKPSYTDPNAVICHVLMTCRVREIVHALYGFVEGLVGALSRLGGHARVEDERELITLGLALSGFMKNVLLLIEVVLRSRIIPRKKWRAIPVIWEVIRPTWGPQRKVH